MYGNITISVFSGGQKYDEETREPREAETGDAGSDGGLFPFRKTVKYQPYHKYSDTNQT